MAKVLAAGPVMNWHWLVLATPFLRRSTISPPTGVLSTQNTCAASANGTGSVSTADIQRRNSNGCAVPGPLAPLGFTRLPAASNTSMTSMYLPSGNRLCAVFQPWWNCPLR